MITISQISSTKTIAAIVAVLVAVAIPARLSGVAVEQTLLGLALLASLILMAVKPAARTRLYEMVTSRQGLLVAGVFVAWAVVLPFSQNPVDSLKIGGRTGLFMLAVAVVASALKEAPQHHDLLKKLLLACAVAFGTIAIVSLWGSQTWIGTTLFAIMTADFDGVVHADGVLKSYATAVVGLLPVVVWAGRSVGGYWRVLGYGYIPVVLAIILLTHDRSALAGIMNVSAFFLLMLALSHKKYVKRIIFSVVAIVTASVLWVRHIRYDYAVLFQDITYLPGWLVDPHRQNIWKFVYHKFLDHPWVGNGIDQMNHLSDAHQTVPGLGPSAFFVPSHPHNWVMEILGETGLIGFVPVVIALGYMIWQAARGYLKDNNETDLAKFLVIVGFWTCSLFSYSIWAVWWQLVFYTLLAILFALKDRPSAAD